MTVDIGTLIEKTPGVVGGRPRIAGSRIAVDHIAMLWRRGYSAEDIVSSVYEHLDLAGVHAALAYYFANRDEIDRSIREEEELGERLAAEQRAARRMGA
jgi:uncharacterized protein (DUF433 family)